MYRTTGYPIDFELRESFRARRRPSLRGLFARVGADGRHDVVTGPQRDRNPDVRAEVLAWHPRVPPTGSGVRDTPSGAPAGPSRDRLDRSWG